MPFSKEKLQKKLLETYFRQKLWENPSIRLHRNAKTGENFSSIINIAPRAVGTKKPQTTHL